MLWLRRNALAGAVVEDRHRAEIPQVDDHAASVRTEPGEAVAAGPHRHGQAGAGRVRGWPAGRLIVEWERWP